MRANGLLLLAIHELPAPQADLLEKSEQLARYLRRQARSDGALPAYDGDDGRQAGPALYGLVLSQRHRPASWKVELVRKSLDRARSTWRKHRGLEQLPFLAGAAAEAHAQTREPAFANVLFELADWACEQQHTQIDQRAHWFGGFPTGGEGKVVSGPDVTGASATECLAQAARIARATGDVARLQRYNEAIVRSLQFLTALQYAEEATQHFAAWYRPRLVGGFHRSHEDGNLRIDYNQQAVCALLLYLEHGGR